MKVLMVHSARMAAMRECGMSIKSIRERFPMYSRATIFRHANKVLDSQLPPTDRRSTNQGRHRKLSIRDERKILRAIPRLRELEGGFTSRRVAVFCGLDRRVSNRTIRRVLQRAGYKYCQSRKKGLLSASDREKRVKFCRRIKNLKSIEFWKKHVSIYLDGVGFQYKTKPFDQAKAPNSRAWRKKSEGLKLTCKGQKEGAVNANFMVAISYEHGVVLCEQYLGRITGRKFAKIVDKSFAQAFQQSVSPNTKRVLQDGCPRQNSREAHEAFDRVNAKVFKIPPRSPDLNPIENFFNNVKNKLTQQALENQIMSETFLQFSERVKQTLMAYPSEEIDKIINSMSKRVNDIIQSGGYRSKY